VQMDIHLGMTMCDRGHVHGQYNNFFPFTCSQHKSYDPDTGRTQSSNSCGRKLQNGTTKWTTARILIMAMGRVRAKVV